MITPTAEQAKLTVDVGAVMLVIGTIAGWLPAVAALLTVIWTGLRIYESILNIRRIKRTKDD